VMAIIQPFQQHANLRERPYPYGGGSARCGKE
jgi:hypothetical protein